jgi:diguanylate cyclase (GGDEF)-like protein
MGLTRDRSTTRIEARGTVRVLALCAGLVGIAVALLSQVGGDEPAAVPGLHVRMLALVIAFGVAESMIIHIEFRREVHSISMAEMPLVIGLLLVAPNQLVAARLVGAFVSLVFHRRQINKKLAFNLSNFALETAVAGFVYHTVAHGAALSGRGIAVMFLGMLVASQISGCGVIAAISLHSGRFQREIVLPALAPLAVVSTANTTLALVGAAVLVHERAAAWLLVGVFGLAFAAYRSHASLRKRYAGLELLYGFTRSVGTSLQTEAAMRLLLAQACTLLRAEDSEILLLGDDGLTTVSSLDDDGTLTARPCDIADESLEARAIASGTTVLAPRTARDDAVLRGLNLRGAKDVISIPLRREGIVVGTFTVANRLGHVSTFDEEDVKLFETVVAHASAALENGHLIDRLRTEAAAKAHQALHDSLTGLGNRGRFHQAVATALAAKPACAAVMLMDLDNFKEVNDTLGHHTGDLLLVEVSTRLAAVTAGRGSVARLGGDEFAVILDDVSGVREAEAVASEIVLALEHPFSIGDLELEVGGSIGLALYPEHGEDSHDLLQKADVAMYEAKGEHRGVAVYSPDRDQSNARRLSLAAELRSAITAGELSVAYQPKVDLAAGRIVGVEALVRWQHPRHGYLPPDEFIPLAEQTGLIRPLTDHVLQQALRQCRAWSELGIDIAVAVNLSARSLADVDLVARTRAALASNGVSPKMLTLEITESMIMADPIRALETLERLAAMGIHLSIDDFGTGYSSLSYLSRLPVHEVKIDRSFVMKMTSQEDDATIVRSVVDLARNLHLTVVAEGVEDAETLRSLHGLGCAGAQGYFVSRPLAASALTARLVELGTGLDAWTPGWAEEPAGPVPLRLANVSAG